jgi:hypothetical protein
MSEQSQPKGAYHMRKIRLELARSRGHAEGSAANGYEFVAPLDAAGHIDVEGWRHERGRCFVHRIVEGVTTERGLLVHRPGGAGGATWAFDYELGGTTEEDAGYRFAAHAFTPGDYVSIRSADGELQTYRIATVAPA